MPADPSKVPADAPADFVPPPYLVGLLLAGRRVVVVGGGPVALRRVRGLLEAAADVVLVAPELTPALRDLVDADQVAWLARPYRPGDLDAAWYAVTATGDPAADEAVAAEAHRRRVFCVRADRPRSGSALTPATGGAAGLRVGVLSAGPVADPRRVAATRDRLLAVLETGDPRPRTPGR